MHEAKSPNMQIYAQYNTIQTSDSKLRPGAWNVDEIPAKLNPVDSNGEINVEIVLYCIVLYSFQNIKSREFWLLMVLKNILLIHL